MPFAPNHGVMPGEAAGKWVRVKLRNGRICEDWPADGKGACRWTFTPEGKPSRDFDVVEWEIVG